METIDSIFRRSLPIVYISYQQVLNRDLLWAMRKKRAPLLPTMLFHHYNEPSHRASTTQETIDRRSIEVLCHPPYSPDLAPLWFLLVPHTEEDSARPTIWRCCRFAKGGAVCDRCSWTICIQELFLFIGKKVQKVLFIEMGVLWKWRMPLDRNYGKVCEKKQSKIALG